MEQWTLQSALTLHLWQQAPHILRDKQLHYSHDPVLDVIDWGTAVARN